MKANFIKIIFQKVYLLNIVSAFNKDIVNIIN